MLDEARVKMFGMNIGTVRWDSDYEVARFEYDAQFAGKGIEPSPLMMPVQQGRVYSFDDLNRDVYCGLPGMLADSLPDSYGRALFDTWLTLTGRTVDNPVERLCFLGQRCMGALEFEPVMEQTSDDMRIEIGSLVAVANEALSKKEEFGANLDLDRKAAIAEILRLGTYAGGQRAKAIIAFNEKTGEVSSGQAPLPEGFDYYLIKLEDVSAEAGSKKTENFGRAEYSFSLLAKECGIEMTDCSLIEENGRVHFLTKRFDRVNGEKVHMQTLCAIAHCDFHLRRAYSYEQVFDVMRRLSLPYQQVEEMFLRMVFNVVIRNQDDHTKNISFLMDKTGRWTLSPAYDIAFAYNPNGFWTRTHQMSINGKFDDITRQDLLACASANNIKNAAEIIDKVCETASKWPEIAKNCDVPQAMIDAKLQYMLLNI